MINAVRRIALAAYAAFLLAPFYWMVNLSFQPNDDIHQSVESFPQGLSPKNFLTVLYDSDWTAAFGHGMAYASLTTAIAMAVALPAAYALYRHRFVGRQTMLGWLLASRLVPAAVFVAAYFEAARATALFDSTLAVALAHCLFTLPLAVWLLKSHLDRVPWLLDETAFFDGFSFPRFFFAILVLVIRPALVATAAFCFLFSWVEFLFVESLTATRSTPIATAIVEAANAAEPPWGTIAAASLVSVLPGLLVVWLARCHIATALSFGQR